MDGPLVWLPNRQPIDLSGPPALGPGPRGRHADTHLHHQPADPRLPPLSPRPRPPPSDDSEDEDDSAADMRPKSRLMDVHQVFQEFADGTSMHGVPRIINARSVTARIFWSMICLLAFAMFFWQCGILLERYYSYPKKVNVEILQQPVPFPAVSVCNVDHLDYEIAHQLSILLESVFGLDDMPLMEGNESFPGGDAGLPAGFDIGDYDDGAAYDDRMNEQMDAGTYPPPTSPNTTHTSFPDRYLSFVLEAITFIQAYSDFSAQKNGIVGRDFTIEALSRLGLPANLGINNTSEGSVRLKDLIISCRFMDDKCNISQSFNKIFDPYYFNCFTFNPEEILPTRSMRLRGVDYGLSLLVFTGSAGELETNTWSDGVFLPGIQESDSALASSRGARVVVHSPDTRPFPTAEGYDIPPGFSVTIGVKAQENVRIAGNHGNCTDNATDPSMGIHFKYTLISCQNRCIQRAIMDQCDCIDNRLSFEEVHEKLDYCFKLPDNVDSVCMAQFADGNLSFSDECQTEIEKWQKKMMCRRQVYDDMTIHKPEVMESCKCYPPCNDIVYDSSYSLSTLSGDLDGNTAYSVTINRYLEQLEPSRKALLEKKYKTDVKQGMMTEIARLNVHIADNNIMKTTESPDYEAIRLVSDIGGQLGLWIGISVMTLFEVLQLIADVFRYLTAKGRHVGEKTLDMPSTISVPKRTYGNGDRFRIPESELELPCEIDKLTTV